MAHSTTRLTIGAFARASGLSAKALRRYDELGLLRPVRVDDLTGYRYYEPAQLERARLVLWLRRIGMPLVRINKVCDLVEADRAAAGHEVAGYWASVESETAARRDLAHFLVGHLTAEPEGPPGRGKTVTTKTRSVPPRELGVRYASRSTRGRVRETNQDAVYAGDRLFAVADGYGRLGAPAGEAAIEALRARLPEGLTGADLLNALADSAESVESALEPFEDSGTTLTALAWTGSQLALVHIGDTRAYLLRRGELFLITHDHSMVQAMVDAGQLDPAEAASHPQRALLLRGLNGGRPAHAAGAAAARGTAASAGPAAAPAGETPAGTTSTFDVRLRDAEPGDRFLLCSDGLSSVVEEESIRTALTPAVSPTPEQAVAALLTLVDEAGAPDNVGCVVADIVAL
ncbi:MerR family transcriptional regulator [Streptomyces fuscigenes]|uniref:MerR family transcriptional regulator n=1 Tax=Streptomyces fuscigenes TaxID=1528880 RepID=UPI001F1B348C|nr:MerR family transcriptional regulator [Streptomyces fuscigenes]MCF3961828.1 protein phosphatase 2C domain-containing protein [Streptomyces fuscigenes]